MADNVSCPHTLEPQICHSLSDTDTNYWILTQALAITIASPASASASGNASCHVCTLSIHYLLLIRIRDSWKLMKMK